MKNFELDHLFIFGDLDTSTATLSIMVDSTSRSISEMYKWSYSDKYEMKELGATIILMKNKSMELYVLGISKMVEDFFNNLGYIVNMKLNVWDSSLDSITFSKETRFIRHLGNVIKHDNSIVNSSHGGISARTLVDKFGFEDDTPIHCLGIFKNSDRDSFLSYIYKANYFCFEVLRVKGLWPGEKQQILEEDAIVQYMMDNYIHSIPGYPNNQE